MSVAQDMPLSLNYNTHDKTCALNWPLDSFPNQSNVLPWTIINAKREQLPLELAGSCTNHSCLVGEKCQVINEMQFECVTEGIETAFLKRYINESNAVSCTREATDIVLRFECSVFDGHMTFDHCPVLRIDGTGKMTNSTYTNNHPSLSCSNDDCFILGSSAEYRGSRTCTISGRICQKWSAQYPHKHGMFSG